MVPVLNEAGTLEELSSRIQTVMDQIRIDDFEIIFIDDGSKDDTWETIDSLVKNDPGHIKAVRFRRNLGKSAALSVGFQMAQGNIVFSMDGDLQDNPEEIPAFLEMLDQGYDLVSGWKKDRKDPLIKVISSRFFNFITSTFSGLKLHDFNCGFKAYRRKTLRHLQLYGELHRYIPVMIHNMGYKVGEIPVLHTPRRSGKSKYGMERYVRGFLDFLTVVTLTNFNQRPGHLFGGLGFYIGVVGVGILIYLAILWFLGGRPIGNRPLFFVGILATVMSVQFISFGLLAEMQLRNTRREEEHQFIEERIGFKDQ
ncbi:MAG: glycosyltransferase family 2 protein [Anaerolineae bacterium]|nr:glycosyltransferase family 2 protein [Anaerolineae bacterium]